MKNLKRCILVGLCMGLASFRSVSQPTRPDTVRVWIPYADADVLDMRLDECERMEKALLQYRAALALSDSLLQAQRQLGNAYWHRGEQYRRLAEVAPTPRKRGSAWGWIGGAFVTGLLIGIFN